MLETMRAFVAVNLDVTSTRRIADAAKRLRARPGAPPAPAVNWVSPTRFHVLVRFLDELDVGLGPALGDLLRPLSDTLGPLPLRLGSFEAHPSADRATALYVPVFDDEGHLDSFAQRLNEQLEELGLPAEKRPFQPHITVARLRTPAELGPWFGAFDSAELGPAHGAECVLYRSDVPRPGAEFLSLARHALTAPSARRGLRPGRNRRTKRTSMQPGASTSQPPPPLASEPPPPGDPAEGPEV
ncbi:MAG: RNA 2',3'-cyclic phosphodiesterase [Polyangiaceae bacterium]|jgi:2'-5' RNA ligase|nr:RNA 2',3'-cyclic phosphodiesterase [Polyangiaceae bacterium]